MKVLDYIFELIENNVILIGRNNYGIRAIGLVKKVTFIGFL